MDSEKLKQFIAQLDQRIASAPNDVTREALQKMKAQAESQLQVLQPYDKMGNLSDSLLDVNSPFYQQFASYLQKTTPGIGANTLLAPLVAGGTGYAGGQAIASAKATELSRERQDKINTGVTGFALNNIGTGASLLGQQGSLGLGIAELNEQRRQFNESNTFWNQIGQGLGGLLGRFLPFGSSGSYGGAGSKSSPSTAVGGYNG